MANTFFQFKQFTVHHDRCAMKVSTDACLFGAWTAAEVQPLRVQRPTLLDVGSGTGLLSLMIIQKKDVLIDAIEIDNEAAEQSKANVEASGWSKKITIFNEDVLRWQAGKKWDYIVSNPPFYETDLKSGKKAKDLAHHADGLTLSNLLNFLQLHLSDEGDFFILLPAKRKPELDKLLPKYGLYTRIIVYVKQTPHHLPFRLMIKGCLKPGTVTEEVMAIKEHDLRYTKEFISLLKDYYLYL